MKIITTDEIKDLLESRHISTLEIEAAISNAESAGKKLYQEDSNRLLAKLNIGGVTFYVEYFPIEKDSYHVLSAYAIRSLIKD